MSAPETPSARRFRDLDKLNDIESILANADLDFGTTEHRTPVHGDTQFTWSYERTREPLSRLYEKAKTSQWNGATDLDWSIDVDAEKVSRVFTGNTGPLRSLMCDIPDSGVQRWTDDTWVEFGIEVMKWRLSQFLHGEQGALVCTAKIVETVPWIDAKYYAASQVIDEARHVEVFARYLRTKLDGEYTVNPELMLLIDDVLGDPRWDITYLGMQIMIEGLALASFGFTHAQTEEPLLRQLLRYVMSDEARHVAFGVLSLQEFYAGLDSREIRERQEFALEAALRMRDRLFMMQVWETMGVPRRAIGEFLERLRASGAWFQGPLFSKIVPNCKKLGILDAGDGWLREKFTEIGVIQYEDAPDTTIEYELLDAVATDRAS